MPPISRADLSRLAGVSKAAVTQAVKRRALASEADGSIDTDLPLNRDWLASLVTPGHPLDAAIRAEKKATDLTKIGMTVGGIGCGTVYLCGDGRLFVWDIFNQPHEGVVAQQTRIPQGLENIAGAGKKVRERDGAKHEIFRSSHGRVW